MGTPHTPQLLPAPTVYPDNQHFWAQAELGRLVLPRCTTCGDVHWFPRPICPFCGGTQMQWQAAAGLGTIYSVSVTRKAGPAPYAIAFVTLDEGVTLLTHIVEGDLDTVRIGERVSLLFAPTDGGPPVPVFRRLSSSGVTP